MIPFKQLPADTLTSLLESEVKLLTPSREKLLVSKQTVFVTILQKIERLVHFSFLSGSAVTQLIKQDCSIPPNDLDWKLLVILPSDERYDRYLKIQTAIIDALSALISQNPAPSNLKQLGLTSKQFTAYSQNHSAATFTILAPKGSLPLEISCHFLSKESDLTYLEHDLYIPLNVFDPRLGSNNADQFMISTHLPIEGTIDSFLSEIQANIISYDPPIGEPKDPAKWIRLMIDLSEKGLYAPSSQIGATWLTEASILNPTTLVSKLLHHAATRRSGIPDYQFFLLLNASMQTDAYPEIQQALLSQLLEASFSVQDLAIQKLFSSLASSLLKFSPSIQTPLLLTCCNLFYPLFATKKEIRLHGNAPHLHLEKRQTDSNQIFYTLIPLQSSSLNPSISSEELLLQSKAQLFLEKGDLFHGTLCLLGSSLLCEKKRSHLELLFQIQNPPEVLDEEVLLNALIKIQGRELSLFFCKNCLRTSSSSTLINECLTTLNRESPSAIWELYKEVYKVKELARTIETNHLEGFLQTIPKENRASFLPLFLHRIQETPFKKCFTLSSFFMTLDPSPKEALTCFSALLDKAQTPEEKESAIALCNLDCYIQENVTPPTSHLPLFLTYFISQHKNGLSFDALLRCLDWIELTPRDIFDEEAATWIRSLLHPFTNSLETLPSECWQKLHGLLNKASSQEPWKKVWCFLIFNLPKADICKDFLRDLSTFTFAEQLPQNLKRMQKKLSELYVRAAHLLLSINHPKASYYIREALQNSVDSFELDSTFQFLYTQKEYSTCLQLLIHEESFQTALSLLPYYKKIIKQVPKAETPYKRTIARVIQTESPETLWNLYLTEGDAADQLEEHVDFSSYTQISQPSQYKTYIKQRLTSTNYLYKLLSYLYDLKEPSFLELVEKQIRSDNKITIEMIDLIFKTCIKDLQLLSSKLPSHLRRELLKNCSAHANFALEDHWDLFVSDVESFTSEIPLSLLNTVSTERQLELIHLLSHHTNYTAVRKALTSVLKGFSEDLYHFKPSLYQWSLSSLQAIWTCRPAQGPLGMIPFILKHSASLERSHFLLKELIPYFDLRSKDLFKNKILQELLSHPKNKTQMIDLIIQKEFHPILLSDKEIYFNFLDICKNNLNHLTRKHVSIITLPVSFTTDVTLLLNLSYRRLSLISLLQNKLKKPTPPSWFIAESVFLMKHTLNIPLETLESLPSILELLEPYWNELSHSLGIFSLLYEALSISSSDTLERYARLIFNTPHLDKAGSSFIVARHLFSKLLQLKKTEAAMMLFEKICVSSLQATLPSIDQLRKHLEFFIEKALPAELIERSGQTAHFIHLATLYLNAEKIHDKRITILIVQKMLDLFMVMDNPFSILDLFQSFLLKIEPDSDLDCAKLVSFFHQKKVELPLLLCDQLLRIRPTSSPYLLKIIYLNSSLTLEILFKITDILINTPSFISFKSISLNKEISILSSSLLTKQCVLSQKILQNLINLSFISDNNELAIQIHNELIKRNLNFEEYVLFLKKSNICSSLFQNNSAIDFFLNSVNTHHETYGMVHIHISKEIEEILSEICLIKEGNLELFNIVNNILRFYSNSEYHINSQNTTIISFQYKLINPTTQIVFDFFEWINKNWDELNHQDRHFSLQLFQLVTISLPNSKGTLYSDLFFSSVLEASQLIFKIKNTKFLRQFTSKYGINPIDSLVHHKQFISHSHMKIISLYFKTFYDYSNFGYSINNCSDSILPDPEKFNSLFNWNAFFQNPRHIDPALSEFFNLIEHLIVAKNQSPYAYSMCNFIIPHLFLASNHLPLFDKALSFIFEYNPIEFITVFPPQFFRMNQQKWHNLVMHVARLDQVPSPYKSTILLENLSLLFDKKNTASLNNKRESLEAAFTYLENNNNYLIFIHYFLEFNKEHPHHFLFEDRKFANNVLEKLSKIELFHLELEEISAIWELMKIVHNDCAPSAEDSIQELFAKIFHPLIQADIWLILSLLEESFIESRGSETFFRFTDMIYKILSKYRDTISTLDCNLIDNITQVLSKISEKWRATSLLENEN